MRSILSVVLLIIITLNPGCDDSNDDSLVNSPLYEELVSDFAADSTDRWGIGVVSNIEFNITGVNFPTDTIRLYDRPSGDLVMSIYKNQYTRSNVETGEVFARLLLENDENEIGVVNRKDFREVAYEGINLKFYQEVDGFVQCLIHSVNGGLWFNVDELENSNFKPMLWKQFLLAEDQILHPSRRSSIPLYDQDGVFQDSLRHGEHTVKLIDNQLGDLIEVEVLNPGPCRNGDGAKVGQAWIYLINYRGHPEVFYNARGC